MPDSLFHFLFPMIAALAARVHLKHPIRNIVLAGLLAVLIDVDHLNFLGPTRASLHNVFITTGLPALLILYTFYFKRSYYAKGFSILLLVFLSSHTFLDYSFGGGVAVLYPVSTTYYSLDFDLLVTEGALVSGPGLGLLYYFASVIIPLLFLDNLIELSEKQHESIRKVLKEIKNKYLKQSS